MKIALGCDHAGFRYKELLKAALERRGHTCHDFGTFSSESTDYPRFVRPAALAVASGECERGIVLGGSGNGEAIVANRIPGIRCTIAWDVESARLGRAHNDSNVLSIGERMVSEEMLDTILDTWLDTPFDGGRHAKRIAMIDAPPEG